MSNHDWSSQMLEPYARERADRLRRLRCAAVALASLFTRYTPEAASRRRAFCERTAADRTLARPLISVYAGPETVPAEAFAPSSLERLVGASIGTVDDPGDASETDHLTSRGTRNQRSRGHPAA